jgi:hypothetical protein
MTTSNYIRDLVAQRTLALRVFGLSPKRAHREAIALVAAEHRSQHNHSPSSEVGGSKLYRRLAQMLSNMHHSRDVGPPAPGTPISGILTPPDPPRIVNPSTVEPDQPKPTILGVWSGRGQDGSSAELIDDADFIPRWRDITTDNWRKSIAFNQKVEEERRALWAIRLAEIRRGRGQ